MLGGAADARADALQVRAPHPLRLVVRVTYAMANRALLATDLTCARHEGAGGTMPRPTWQLAGATETLLLTDPTWRDLPADHFARGRADDLHERVGCEYLEIPGNLLSPATCAVPYEKVLASGHWAV
jgi:hypothetical protein